MLLWEVSHRVPCVVLALWLRSSFPRGITILVPRSVTDALIGPCCHAQVARLLLRTRGDA